MLYVQVWNKGCKYLLIIYIYVCIYAYQIYICKCRDLVVYAAKSSVWDSVSQFLLGFGPVGNRRLVYIFGRTLTGGITKHPPASSAKLGSSSGSWRGSWGVWGHCGGVLFQRGPVEEVIKLMPQGTEQNTEELAEVHVVGRLVKAETTTVVKVHRKFRWETFAQYLNLGGNFLFTYSLVLLALCIRLHNKIKIDYYIMFWKKDDIWRWKYESW